MTEFWVDVERAWNGTASFHPASPDLTLQCAATLWAVLSAAPPCFSPGCISRARLSSPGPPLLRRSFAVVHLVPASPKCLVDLFQARPICIQRHVHVLVDLGPNSMCFGIPKLDTGHSVIVISQSTLSTPSACAKWQFVNSCHCGNVMYTLHLKDCTCPEHDWETFM